MKVAILSSVVLLFGCSTTRKTAWLEQDKHFEVSDTCWPYTRIGADDEGRVTAWQYWTTHWSFLPFGNCTFVIELLDPHEGDRFQLPSERARAYYRDDEDGTFIAVSDACSGTVVVKRFDEAGLMLDIDMKLDGKLLKYDQEAKFLVTTGREVRRHSGRTVFTKRSQQSN